MKPAAPSRPDVELFDTTLRDGTQGEGLSLSCDDKLRIARRLDELGVACIEGGWPGSNPKDAEFFARAREARWTSSIVAFGATRRAGLCVEDDASVCALLEAGTAVCSLFGKSSPLHVREVLRAPLAENLRMIEETVAFLAAAGRRVIYDAEHFFDGWAEDREYALETLRAAVSGGADVIVLCDTNGGSLPWQVGEATAAVCAALGPTRVGVHAHDDSGCSVASSLAAVAAGARHVQGTINGYGERCGNADLCQIIPSLELKMGLRCLPPGALAGLGDAARFVAEVANLPLDERTAYVGRSAFAHKAGVHVAAQRRTERAYQHVDPALVGNEARVLVSELAGRQNVAATAAVHGVTIDGEAARRVVDMIKQQEARGFSYEAAEASVALLLRRESPGYEPPFRLASYQVWVGRHDGSGPWAEATVRVAVAGRVVEAVAGGNGPVSALDAALRRALAPHLPAIASLQLVDYKVRILDGARGTASTTRVLIDSSDGHRRWSTVGASDNVIEASAQALADGIEYGLSLAETAAEPQLQRGAVP